MYGNVSLSSQIPQKSLNITSKCHNGLILLVNRTMFSTIRALHSSVALESKSQNHSQFIDRSLFCRKVYEAFYDSNKDLASAKYVKHIPCFNTDKPIDSINQTRIRNSQFTYVLNNQKEAKWVCLNSFRIIIFIICVLFLVSGIFSYWPVTRYKKRMKPIKQFG